MSRIKQQIECLRLEAEMLGYARNMLDLMLGMGNQGNHYKKVLGQKDYDKMLDDLAEVMHKALMSKAPKVGS